MAGPILWRRLDRPGHEAARIARVDSGWQLLGAAVFLDDRRVCRLDYEVVCDSNWRTRTGRVSGWLGDESIRIEITFDSGRWRLNAEAIDLAGCVDLDLNFSPSTNLLPIRRLNLAVGQQASVRAAWLRFPSFALEPLDQLYRRTATSTYRYESAGGQYIADLEIDDFGFVKRYPGFAEAVSG